MHLPHRFATAAARTLSVAAAALLLLPALPARADALVTPAGGGSNIPADRALRGGDAAGATALGPITLQELTPGDIGDGKTGALTLQLPAGFAFSAAAAPDVQITTKGCVGLAIGRGQYQRGTGSTWYNQVRFEVTGNSTTLACSVQLGYLYPLAVAPIAPTPLPAPGNLTLAPGSLGIRGVTADTSFGAIGAGAGRADVAKSTLTAGRTAMPADGLTTTTVTVTVVDRYGNIARNRNISLASDRDSDSIAPTLAATNDAGVATFVVSSNQAGASTFKAADADYNLALNATAKITFTANASSTAGSSIAVRPAVLPADAVSQADVTVTLLQPSGAPSAGKTVRLTSDRGATDSITPATAVSGVDGQALFSIRSGRAGVATLSAYVVTDDQAVTKTAQITFTAPGGVGTPQLLEPTDATRLDGLGTTLRWQSPTGATWYQLQVAPSNNDGPGIDLVIGDSAQVAAGRYEIRPPALGASDPSYVMLPDMTYTWRVRTAATATSPTEADWSGWSANSRFRTAPRTSAGIRRVAPAEDSTVGPSPTLVWSNTDTSVFYYEVQLSLDPQFGTGAGSPPLYFELRHGGITQPPNSYTLPSGLLLAADATYYWRVRPRVQGDGTPVAWSQVFRFTTGTATRDLQR